MKIKFFPPFHALGGDLVEIKLDREMALQEFCLLLLDRFPKLSDFLPRNGGESTGLLAHVFLVTTSENPARVLCPSDLVRDEDTLQILPPFDGG